MVSIVRKVGKSKKITLPKEFNEGDLIEIRTVIVEGTNNQKENITNE